MENKVCCDCGLEKPIDKFGIARKGKDVIYRLNFCNPCAWIRRKKTDNPSNYYYAKNKEAWNIYQREYAKRKRAEKKLQKNATDFCNKM
jgi:RecA-family ATPase